MKRVSLKFFVGLIYILIVNIPLYASVYTGKVIDVYTRKPISNAEVTMPYNNQKVFTDNTGSFSVVTDVDRIDSGIKLEAHGNQITWEADKAFELSLTDMLGRKNGYIRRNTACFGSFELPNLSDGMYLLTIQYNGNKETIKILRSNKTLYLHYKQGVTTKSGVVAGDTITIKANGYYIQKYKVPQENHNYELMALHYPDVDYFSRLVCPESFVRLQSLPLNPTFGEVKTVKIVYSIKDGKIYYVNSEKYLIHYDFAQKVLNYSKGHYMFNIEQYKKNPNRIYILGSINHFTASGIYTLTFFPGDELDCSDVETVYRKVSQTSFYGEKLRFYANNTKWNTCTSIPNITSDELYAGQNYQPLNPAEGFGYFKKVDIKDIETTYLGRHDIIMINGIPNDISVTSGIITTEFQTPLSHINVLSHNRGTPNMALRNGWTNPKIEALVNKLVYLKVTFDSFYIREANLTEAQAFWAQKEPQTPQKLKLDTLTTGLVDLSKMSVTSVPTIGGKAANFAELMKIKVYNQSLPLPENPFAIPVYYYWQHMKKYGLDKYVHNMLKNPDFWKDASLRALTLEKLQDSIKNSPLDTALLRMVNDKLKNITGFKNIRFRSSTNAEDIEGFNGAGLYESFTGIPGDSKKTIDKAIRKVWASLWYFRAFEERDYFKIDHEQVAMAVLVHRSFPVEEANGVVITKNMFNSYNSAITVNVQVGEISIVLPTENYLPDQIIYYLNATQLHNAVEYVSHTTVPGWEGKTVLTDDELKTVRDYSMAIHNHYCALNFECKTMDIEFKVDNVNGSRKVYIKQARLY